VTDAAIAKLTPVLGTRAACRAVGRPQATHYRRHRTSPLPIRPASVPPADRIQPRALSAHERQRILDGCHEQRFVDASSAHVWATLLDEGVYLGSAARSRRADRRSPWPRRPTTGAAPAMLRSGRDRSRKGR
jgi:putative transposase